MANLLVVDDDQSIVESFRELFKDRHRVCSAPNGVEAIRCLRECKIDLVFLDYRMPGEDGLEVLKRIREVESDAFVVMITAFGTYETIIHAISLGAYDYIEKPLDIDKITVTAGRAIEAKKMRDYVRVIKDEQFESYNLKRIVGGSAAMQEIFKSIGRVVNNDVTVLITGESGTGKELIARALHYNSDRKSEPFVAVNCSALADTLLENELFGHEAQAFTGAQTARAGKFEAAGEGTIFLDEIGDMPLATQSKLLRILQEREFVRLGGNRVIQLKARIITATNKNLADKIKDASFRQDLFYRINVAAIDLPPLRRRKEDIPLLVAHFIRLANFKLKKNIRGATPEALERLGRYDWPGNVRELENIITNICIHLQNNLIGADGLPDSIRGGKQSDSLISRFLDDYLARHSSETGIAPRLFDEIESQLIQKVGESVKFNKSTMARILGLSRVTVHKKIKEDGN